MSRAKPASTEASSGDRGIRSKASDTAPTIIAARASSTGGSPSRLDGRCPLEASSIPECKAPRSHYRGSRQRLGTPVSRAMATNSTSRSRYGLLVRLIPCCPPAPYRFPSRSGSREACCLYDLGENFELRVWLPVNWPTRRILFRKRIATAGKDPYASAASLARSSYRR